MSMYQGLDLSKFKKVSSDKQTSTLRHAKGHEIKIAHNGISPKMREHLGKLPVYMAEGGEAVSMEPEQDEESAPIEPQPVEAAPTDDAPEVAEPAQPEAAPVAQPATVQAAAPAVNIDAQDLKNQDAAWAQDLANGHIHEKTYQELFDKKSTLGKAGTLFGLLLSGLGSGLTGQPNAVMEMMKTDIANDLEAQKKSKDNANNWLQRNQQNELNKAQISRWQQEGKLTEAQAKATSAELGFKKLSTTAQIAKWKQEGILNEAQAKGLLTDVNVKSVALANMQMNRAYLHKITEDVAKMPPGSPGRAAAEQQLALLNQGVQNENFNIADRAAAASALGKLAYGDGKEGKSTEGDFQKKQGMLRMSGSAPIADDRASRHMPGVPGQASIPLTSGDRDQITSGITFQNQLERFMDWTKKHSGDLKPSERNEGEALAAQLQGAYRMATHGGVYKEGEQGFISHIIDSTPTKFLNQIRVLPQLKAVKGESAAQLDQLLKSKGFQGYKPTAKTGVKNGDVVTRKDGGQYRKIEGGYEKVNDKVK